MKILILFSLFFLSLRSFAEAKPEPIGFVFLEKRTIKFSPSDCADNFKFDIPSRGRCVVKLFKSKDYDRVRIDEAVITNRFHVGNRSYRGILTLRPYGYDLDIDGAFDFDPSYVVGMVEMFLRARGLDKIELLVETTKRSVKQ